MAQLGRLRLFAVPLAVALLTATVGVPGSDAHPSAHSRLTAPFETDVNNSGAERSGEPELAVDPFDPAHIALSAFEAINTYSNPMTFAQRATAENSSWCSLQISRDAGTTWSAEQRVPQSYTEPPNSPFTPGKVHTNTTDCMLAWGPDGRLYEGGAVFVAEPAQYGQANLGGINFPLGGDSIASSTDGGQTFTAPVDPINSEQLPSLIARGLTPSTNGFANPYDRPWLRVDQSTGTVYLAATGHPQYYVTASHDNGATWTRLEALDCDEATPPGGKEICGAYPEIGGGLIDAAHGVLAAAYLAGAAGQSGGNAGAHSASRRRAHQATPPCPCAIFETSRDDGQHWSRHVVAGGLSTGAVVQVAADPRQRHRYAVAVITGAKTTLDVYRTTDSGRHWSGPASLGNLPAQHVVNRSWIAYSPRGFLGAFWRTAFPPFQPSFLQSGTQNVYVALSRDGGRTFGAPVQINAAPSPPPDPAQVAEDDVSWLSVTNNALYGAWGDWRATPNNTKGDLNSWFGRVVFGPGSAGSSGQPGGGRRGHSHDR